MEQKRSYFELISSQRYFHLIAIKPETSYTANDYWKQCGVIQQSNKHSRHETTEFIIDHKRILTDISFYNGERDFSINSDGKAPFSYDLFTVELLGTGILILGFPFKFLAKTILSTLIKQYNFLKQVSFLKCDLNKLIKRNTDSIAKSERFHSYFSAVDLILSGDTNISTVGLDGDKPLESVLFKTFFEDRIQKDECLLDKCTVKCEVDNFSPKTKSNIHIDVFGNYKLYIHGSGNNIFTIPFLFEALNTSECLKTTIGNPISRLNDE